MTATLIPPIPPLGSLPECRKPETRDRLVSHLAVYDKTYIPNERHEAFHAELDEMRETLRRSRGQPQLGLVLSAEPGSGKTTGYRRYEALVLANEGHAPDQHPVLYLPLGSAARPKELFAQILIKLGDRYAHAGTEETLRARAYEFMRRAGVELVVIDETQHLIHAETQKTEWRVADVLKRFLDDGVAAIVLMGMSKVDRLAQTNAQFALRLRPPFRMDPLDLTRPDDLKFFAQFVGALDDAIVANGLMKAPADLLDNFMAACLQEVSKGIIGRISRLTRLALSSAIRRGADRIELYDYALATESWAVRNKLIDYNPFLFGPRSADVTAENDGDA